MTRQRLVSGETPFGSWLRNNKALDAQSEGLYITDIDYTVFRFREGTMFLLEIKTRGAPIGRHQSEVFSILDQTFRMSDGKTFDTLRGRRLIRLCGVYTLILSGTTPEDSAFMKFGRIGCEMYLITKAELERILRGENGLTPENWLAIKRRDCIQGEDKAA